MSPHGIQINKKNYSELHKLYDRAVKESKSEFTYKGIDLLTSYAKYVLEYMKIVLDKKGDE